MHISELEKRALNIARSLSEMLEGNSSAQARQGSGYGAFLRFIEDISANEAWVVGSNLRPLFCGNPEHGDHFALLSKELPASLAQTAFKAMNEKKLVSISASAHFKDPSVMAAAPIIQRNGNVAGAVLLLSHISGPNEATRNGVTILALSMALAVLISVFVAIELSSRFALPLEKMQNAALQISSGDYSAKTGVVQQDEIGELALIIDEMAEKLQESMNEHTRLDKLRGDFIANISHELRTPVTVIRGSLEALCDGIVEDSAKVAEYHEHMLSESIHLERLVSDMLDLSCLQDNDFAIELEKVDLKEVIEDAVRSMKRIADAKKIKIALSCFGACFAAIGDYARLRQMLIIILDNAIKFSENGATVAVELSNKDSELFVSVSDKGCGISHAELPNIFERFYKQRSEENKTGTGLGLAIAKQIAERHNAGISVKSSLGVGTEFIFAFKAAGS
ncbi:MAG: HAMP domain-containing histidine kinase [Eubacteriaceae bacterium]|nr:HAMP domain-containing histidine kinase [Eubacteriaceae bacterium]